jgi:hypothetical protein
MDMLIAAICLLLVAILVLGAVYLVRKHGGWKNAMYGGTVELIGEVPVGTLADGDGEFRISKVVRPDKPSWVLFRMKKSDSEGWSVTTLTMTTEQAVALSSLLAKAAGTSSSEESRQIEGR